MPLSNAFMVLDGQALLNMGYTNANIVQVTAVGPWMRYFVGGKTVESKMYSLHTTVGELKVSPFSVEILQGVPPSEVSLTIKVKSVVPVGNAR
jgi:hypothetical protein